MSNEQTETTEFPGVDKQLQAACDAGWNSALVYAVDMIRQWKGPNGDGDWEPADLLTLRRNK